MDTGISVREIAETLGVAKSSVYGACKRYGIKRQESERKTHATETAQSTHTKERLSKAPDNNGTGSRTRRPTRQTIDLPHSSFATNTPNARAQPYPTEPLRLLRKDIITSQKPRAPPALSEQEIMLLGFMRKQILAARKAYGEPDGIMRVAGALLSVYKTQMELAKLYRRKLQLGSMERYREDASELMNMLRPMIAGMNSAKKNGIDPSSIDINLELGTYLARGGYFARIDLIEREMSEG